MEHGSTLSRLSGGDVVAVAADGKVTFIANPLD